MATDSGTGLAEQHPAGELPRDPQAEYADVRHRIRGLVSCLIERDSTVAVVSKGDPELVRLESVQGWHFPRATDGKYAGHHPADGAEVITHLEQLREKGADYFLLPNTYFWWLDHYEGLVEHLGSRYRLVADCPDACLIYDLRAGPIATGPRVANVAASARSSTNGAEVQHPLVPAIRALLDSLLPVREPVLVASQGDDELLRLGRMALDFPDDEQGSYRSIDSLTHAAITAQLTSARANRVRYLVLPDTARHWADPSGALYEALRERAREVAARAGICAIYELENAEGTQPDHASTSLRRALRRGGGRSDD